MLDKQTVDAIRKTIKEINKEKSIDIRLALTIEHKNSVRYTINEQLDDLFAEVDLKPKKLQYDDDEHFN